MNECSSSLRFGIWGGSALWRAHFGASPKCSLVQPKGRRRRQHARTRALPRKEEPRGRISTRARKSQHSLRFFTFRRLTTERETISQQARETGGNDLFAGAFNVVTDPALFDQIFVGVVNTIGSAPITVTWLSDATGINEILFPKLDVNLFLLGAMSAFVANESTLDVSMAEETDGGVLVSETGGRIEVAKDVAPLRGSI